MSLGVGVVYWPGLEPLLESNDSPADVVEVEPQPFWVEADGPSGEVRADPAVMRRICALPQRRLVHGVSCPVGNTAPPNPRHLELFALTTSLLRAGWASEHLSFNRVAGAGGEFGTGFLLPPLQTEAGVQLAAARIRELKRRLEIPFAVETGVNYLRPRADEMSDGDFVAAVARAADCGILLDLHNVWTNQRNGRQSIDAFLSEIPLERVVELHMAGGLERDGYWLDAHSGEIPADLIEIARRVVPALPGLGAIIFELMPQYIPALGLDGVRRQLDTLHGVWALRRAQREVPAVQGLHPHCAMARGGGAGLSPVRSGGGAQTTQDGPAHGSTPLCWQKALGELVVRGSSELPGAAELSSDPGVALLRKLVAESRAGIVAGALRLTTRLLLLCRGESFVRDLLEAFHQEFPPAAFSSSEADAFAGWIESRGWLGIPYLQDVLTFERALARVSAAGGSVKVRFGHDPWALLEALAEGRLPESPRPGDYALEVAA